MVYQKAPDEGKRDGVRVAAATLAAASEIGDLVRAHGLTWERVLGGVWFCRVKRGFGWLMLTAKAAGPDIWSLRVRFGHRVLHEERCPTGGDLLRRAAKVSREARPLDTARRLP